MDDPPLEAWPPDVTARAEHLASTVAAMTALLRHARHEALPGLGSHELKAVNCLETIATNATQNVFAEAKRAGAKSADVQRQLDLHWQDPQATAARFTNWACLLLRMLRLQAYTWRASAESLQIQVGAHPMTRSTAVFDETWKASRIIDRSIFLRHGRVGAATDEQVNAALDRLHSLLQTQAQQTGVAPRLLAFEPLPILDSLLLLRLRSMILERAVTAAQQAAGAGATAAQKQAAVEAAASDTGRRMHQREGAIKLILKAYNHGLLPLNWLVKSLIKLVEL